MGVNTNGNGRREQKRIRETKSVSCSPFGSGWEKSYSAINENFVELVDTGWKGWHRRELKLVQPWQRIKMVSFILYVCRYCINRHTRMLEGWRGCWKGALALHKAPSYMRPRMYASLIYRSNVQLNRGSALEGIHDSGKVKVRWERVKTRGIAVTIIGGDWPEAERGIKPARMADRLEKKTSRSRDVGEEFSEDHLRSKKIQSRLKVFNWIFLLRTFWHFISRTWRDGTFCWTDFKTFVLLSTQESKSLHTNFSTQIFISQLRSWIPDRQSLSLWTLEMCFFSSTFLPFC